MRNILIAVGASLALMAVVTATQTEPKRMKSEDWLEGMMLESVGDYQLKPDSFGSKVSYRMSDSTYEILKPIGIACQILENTKGEEVDVVVIAGDSMEAFHDQKICFAAQGWDIEKQEVRTIKTKSHGEIPVWWMTIKRPGGPSQESMYIFRTPLEFSTYEQAKFSFLKARMKDPFAESIGYSYRFIALTPGMSADELTKVAVDYMDKLDENTNGVM